jgi:hypothetical protein
MISQWVETEVTSVDLGDQRLDRRMATLLSSLGSRPNLSIPAACGGHAEIQAAYRFFDNPKVTFDKVLAPHGQQTLERLSVCPVVLLVQDTTEIDLTRPQQEVLGAGDLDGSRRGVLMHVMHAFTPEGTPLGSVWADYINRREEAPPAAKARKESKQEKEQKRRHTPIEQKESLRWITGLRQARAVAGKLPQAQCVCMADSEGDIYELFAEPCGREPDVSGREPDAPDVGRESAGKVDWLVRACHDRAVQIQAEGEKTELHHPHLRERLLAAPVLYKVELLVRGRQAKTTVEKRPRRQARQTRQIEVEIRAASVRLRPPWRPDRQLPPVKVNVVLVSEVNPPPGEAAVEWVLLTTLPIDRPGQARQIVEYYCVRWNIEILFRTLKSGCRIERRRFEDVERILPCLAMYLIVAWRTLFVCHLGRELPDADCELIFEPSEWKAAWSTVIGKKPPSRPPRLREIVHLIGRLGGYIQRPGSEPGPQTIWIGLQRMRDLAWAWDTFGPQTKINTG